MRWDDFIRNEEIRGRLCRRPVSLKLGKAMLKLFGHVERMGEERQVKRNTNSEMLGSRPVG